MKIFLLLATSLLLLPLPESYAIDNPKMIPVATLCEENLAGKPVFTCDGDNCVGIIAESVDNFPKPIEETAVPSSQQSVDESSQSFNFLPDFSNLEPTISPEIVSIEIAGISTAVPLVNWQAKAVKILREIGKNPVAEYKTVEQIVTTPGQQDTLVKFKIAVWKII